VIDVAWFNNVTVMYYITLALHSVQDQSSSSFSSNDLVIKNQTVNDGVAHSKNPKKCAYHVTFDLDLDLEHTLDAR